MSDRDTAYWDEMASTYDEGPDHGLRDPVMRQAWRSLLHAQLPPAPAEVVDLGCGTGTLSVLLAEDGYVVRGIDSAANMVAMAQRKVVDTGLPPRRATFARGDAAHPPCAPASCDVVLVRHVLWAMPDPAEAVSRWASLVRPGGRMVLIEGTWHTGGGIAAAECERLLSLHTPSVLVQRLDDPALWGEPLRDERYLATATT